jgi:hypothetical protein
MITALVSHILAFCLNLIMEPVQQILQEVQIQYTCCTNLGIRSTILLSFSVADSDPGSGAFLTLGSGIVFFRIPDLGSRASNPYFLELNGSFLGRKF